MDSSSIKDVLTGLFDISKTFKEPKRFVSFLLLVLLIGFIIFSQTPAFNNILASVQLDNNQVFRLIVILLSFLFVMAMVILVADIAKKTHKPSEHEFTVTVHVYRPPYQTNHIVDALVKVAKPGAGVVDQRTDNTGIATFQFSSMNKGKKATFCAWKNDQNSKEITELLKDHLHVEIAWDFEEREQEALPPPPPDKDEARQSYLNAIITDCRTLRLDVLDEQAGDPNAARLSLEDVYIALNTTTSRVGLDKRGREKPNDMRTPAEIDDKPPLTVMEALLAAPDRKMVLLGLPGTGKSTFIRFLSLRLAQKLSGEMRDLDQWEGTAVIPILISLGRFADALDGSEKQGNARLLEDFIKFTLSQDKRTELIAGVILELARSEGAIFFFDGLDEVADLDLRPVVVQSIDAFVQKYGKTPNSRFLVTCRTFSYQDPNWQLPRWVAHEIALLTDEQIKDFVTAWYDQHALLDQTRTRNYYNGRRDQLLAALEPDEPRQLLGIARFPIILTIMAIVHASYDLPDSRAQVYMRCVDLLLVKWQVKKSIQGREQTRDIVKELDIPSSRLQKALFEIAFNAHLGRDGSSTENSSLITGELVTSILEKYLGDNQKLKIFLDYCQSSNGLLMLSGVIKPEKTNQELPPRRVYTFPHMTFEEYLASRHLEMFDPKQIRDLLDAAHDRWRTVVLMLVEYLCYERSDDLRANALFEELITPRKGESDLPDWRAIWLAGESLLVYRRAIGTPPSPHEQKIINKLCNSLGASSLQPRERVVAGDTLARLGDPRPEVMSVDGMRFCFVPAGEFCYGEGKEAQEKDLPAFWLAEYPTSNAQFQAFLAEDGYLNGAWWPEARKDGCWSEQGFKGRLDDESRTAPYHYGEPFDLLNHPVVGVSWYEAMAFTHWLTTRWHKSGGLPAGWQVSLPHEWQWEKAARGGLQIPAAADDLAWELAHIYSQPLPGLALQPNPAERREYPWPGQFDANKANTIESSIGATSALGCFPLGASPYGIQELSGNVWEWQENWSDQDKKYKTLRGGSFGYSRGYVRCALRHGDFPGHRGRSHGLRLVLSPFAS